MKLVGHAFIIKSTAPTDAFLQREVGEVVHPQGRGGGIGNAHLAEGKELRPTLMGFVDGRYTYRERPMCLFWSHRRFSEEGTSTTADLAVH